MPQDAAPVMVTLTIAGAPVTFPHQVSACRNPLHPGPCAGPRKPRTSRLSPRKASAKPKKKVAPASPEAIAARERKVEKVVGEAIKTLATHKTHTGPGGAWNPDRDAVHREIVNDLYQRSANVPNEGRAVIAGGLGGAGKTTVLRDHANIDPDEYMTINPDDIKEEMAKRDLIPTIPGNTDLSPMERAALVHEESSRIAHLLADRAYQERKNVIWDITMSSESSVRSRVDALKNKGYDEIKGIFVDIPVEVSVDRALARYRRGLEDWRNGTGHGGRFVPPAIIRAQRTGSGRTVNRDTFDTLKSVFDDWKTYDNSVNGRAPQLVEQKGNR